ncbi:MAG TPA: thiamine pyrophosphate-binding protein [candidate division Zixibacteria bacterium]|nr:thiamine pyrophosphate-binding protein [candidate division Zixibacteria bacterium]
MSQPAHIVEKPRPEWGSDVIVEMLKAFGIEYVALNPGSSFRGLHDSLANYGGNRMPEMILCPHEEIAVGVAHGYARAKGKPMAAAVHNVVGLQHSCMAIYNAWCDRLPVLVLGGTGPTDTAHRRPRIDWVHTACVQGNLVRDFVKWDDQPASVEAIPESFIRAYRLATTDPMGPVYLCYDADIQEKKLDGEVPIPSLERYPAPLPLQAPEEGLEKTVRWLLEAKAPVIIADWVGRSEAGFRALRDLAELLAIPVLDQNGRFNFPTRHPLNLTGAERRVLPRTDLVLALDVPDLEGAVARRVQDHGKRATVNLLPAEAKVVNVGLDDLLVRAWSQEFNRLRQADLSIMADTAVFLPEIVRRLRTARETLAKIGPEIESRRAEWSRISEEQRIAREERTRARWNDKPIALSRVFTELNDALKGEDWVYTNSTRYGAENFYIDADRFNQILGKFKGGGLGYGLPASLGATLAHRNSGKICVDFQPDGDLLFTLGGLWTASHYSLPLLIVVFSNRSYYNDEEHQERMAQLRRRPVENKVLGIRIEEPAVDFATTARSFGIWSRGPITEPRELPHALGDALKVVKDGKPALVDVVCEMRP